MVICITNLLIYVSIRINICIASRLYNVGNIYITDQKHPCMSYECINKKISCICWYQFMCTNLDIITNFRNLCLLMHFVNGKICTFVYCTQFQLSKHVSICIGCLISIYFPISICNYFPRKVCLIRGSNLFRSPNNTHGTEMFRGFKSLDK